MPQAKNQEPGTWGSGFWCFAHHRCNLFFATLGCFVFLGFLDFFLATVITLTHIRAPSYKVYLPGDFHHMMGKPKQQIGLYAGMLPYGPVKSTRKG